jgi:hypothetical protein
VMMAVIVTGQSLSGKPEPVAQCLEHHSSC